MYNSIRIHFIVLLSLVLGLGVCANGQETYWLADSDDYFDSNNWNNGMPTHRAFITNGGTAQIDTSGRGAVWQFVGTTQGTTGNLEMTDGNVIMGNLYLGDYGTGTVKHTGGRLTLEAEFWLGIGDDGGMGVYEISGTAELNMTNYYSQQLTIGGRGTGIVRQSGGLVSITQSSIRLSGSTGGFEGRYELSGGRLNAKDINIGFNGDGHGVMQQTNGICDVTGTILTQGRYELHGGQLQTDTLHSQSAGVILLAGGTITASQLIADNGEIHISGGTVNVTSLFRVSGVGGYTGAGGVLRVTGADATIVALDYHQGSDGLLVSQIDDTGISRLSVLNQAMLGGQLQIVDAGASLGRYDILMAGQGFSGAFDSVVLPGADWSWGIDNGQVLWVEHIPEPATMSLLAFGGLAMMRRRRK